MEFFILLTTKFWMTTALASLLGIMIGSFLNVVIYRLPIMIKRSLKNSASIKEGKGRVHFDTFNLALPRSACPCCDHQISAIENIPLLSYLALRGRCRGCNIRISMRYPFVELLTCALSGASIWFLGAGTIGILTMVSSWILVGSSYILLDTSTKL